MFAYTDEPLRIAQIVRFARKYDFDRLIEYLVDDSEPLAVSRDLRLVYFSAVEAIMRDRSAAFDPDLSNALYTVRTLSEALEKASQGGKSFLSIIYPHFQDTPPQYETKVE